MARPAWDDDVQEFRDWRVDQRFGGAVLPIGRPSLDLPQNRGKFSAATESNFLLESATLMSGKRVRKQVASYTDQGASTRLKPTSVPVTIPNHASPVASTSTDPSRSRHPLQAARAGERGKPSKVKRKAEHDARVADETASLLAQADLLWANFSWKQRKQLAICAFSQARADGLTKNGAARKAGEAARVNYETARGWVYEWLQNDGKMSASRWGRGVKIPSVFLDEEVIIKSHKWWADKAPKRGDKNARISDFHKYLCGDPESSSIGGKRGLLHRCLGDTDRIAISEEMCRQFTVDLGYEHADLRKGSFNDKHNSDENVQDRQARFIPEYLRLFNLGPSFVDINGEHVCVDDLADQGLRLNKFYEIVGGDGEARLIDMCGELPHGGRRIPILITVEWQR